MPERKSIVLFTGMADIGGAVRQLRAIRLYRGCRIARIVLLDGGKPGTIHWQGIPLTALCEDAIALVCHDWVDEAFFLPAEGAPFPDAIVERLIGLGISVSYPSRSAGSRRGHNARMYRCADGAVRLERPIRAAAWQLAVKRAFDIVGGLIGVGLTGLVCLFVAPAIAIVDPGPVFFTQERIGRNGKHILIHKFRSMIQGAEASKPYLMPLNEMGAAPMFKLSDDPRIIGSERRDRFGRPRGLGNFLRRTSLDEFPQFFDCLTGQLSLVGWRPCTVAEWNAYAPPHRVRACMKPGITGIWQISGRSSITDFDELLQLERSYLENWSLTEDFKILLKTIPAVISGRGAK